MIMATIVTKTVKPAGGGDYVSINTFELNEREDIVSSDKVKRADVYSGGDALSGAVSFNTGWTTDPTRYIEIRAADGEEHDGIWSTSKAYGIHNTTSGPVIDIAKNVHINKMQFYSDMTGGSVVQGLIHLSGAVVVIDRCFLWTIGDFVPLTLHQESSSTLTITNSVVIQKNSTPGYTAMCLKCYNSTFTGYNCAFVSYTSADAPDSALQGYFSTLTTENCYFRSANGKTYWDIGSSTFNKGSKDATSGTDATDANLRSIAYSTDNFLGVTYGSEDLRLVVSDSNKLIDGGVNLSGSGVVEDIIGTSRPQFAAFDIGPFENDTPICWNYTARYLNSGKLFKMSGPGPFPRYLNLPSNVDQSTGRLIDDGIEIDPEEYEVI